MKDFLSGNCTLVDDVPAVLHTNLLKAGDSSVDSGNMSLIIYSATKPHSHDGLSLLTDGKVMYTAS